MSNNFEVDSILVSSGEDTVSFTGPNGKVVNVNYKRTIRV